MADKRRLSSFLQGFSKLTDHMGVPLLWRKWAGVSAISGALERRCVLHTAKGALSPNVFVLLVSPPGVGKTVVINIVYDLWARVAGLNVAPSSTTRAGLIDFMVDARKVDVSKPLPFIYHSVLCASAEFGNLVPQYDNAWLNILNDIYDCGKLFSDMTRKYGEIKIEHPHMVMLAGTQPKYLDNLLPEAAFGMGFTSRLILAYSGEQPYISLFNGVKKSAQLENWLVEDLTTISKLHGDFFLTPEAEDTWEALAAEGFPPSPDHSKLQHYSSRRPAHILKLMMCFSAAERNDLRILPEHVEKAHTLLLETEKEMPAIFQEMQTKGFGDAIEEVYGQVLTTWKGNGRKPIHETQLIKFLVTKVHSTQVKGTIDLMVQGGLLTRSAVVNGGAPYKVYTPNPKKKG